MRLDTLRLNDFRNLRNVEITPDPRFNVFVGDNGQGKTNLLEAVYVLAALKSFRMFKNRHLIEHDAEEARCAAWVDRGGMRREVEVVVRPSHKRVSLNGSPVRRLSDFFGTVNAVAFCPEDIGVLKGSPADRRLFLDRMVFHANPAYASENHEYESALRQRNALLKGDRIDLALLDVWDEQLITYGVRVMRRRFDYLERLQPPFGSTFAEIFDPALTARVRYAPDVLASGADLDALFADDQRVADTFREALLASRPTDMRRGFTSAGPHRDEFSAWLGGQPVKSYASQGQHRAFVLALKITEIRLLETQLGFYPVLLLDDVSSELDPQKNALLFDFLSGIDGQVFITTTDVDFIRLSHPFTEWRVRGGEVLT